MGGSGNTTLQLECMLLLMVGGGHLALVFVCLSPLDACTSAICLLAPLTPLLCPAHCTRAEPPGAGCDTAAPPPHHQQQQHSAAPPQQQQGQQQDQQQQQQLQALMATLERQLQHAQAMGAPLPAPLLQQLQQQQAGSASSSRPASASSTGGGADPFSALLSSVAAAAGGGVGAGGQSQQQSQPQQPQQPPFLLQLGPALARSVKQTQLFRLLAAVLLAYAALTGWQLGLPPVLLLFATDLAVVLAGAFMLPANKGAGGGANGAAAEGGGGGAGGDVQVPWRLRSLDWLSLVPGLRELMDSVAGYNAVATALSQDFAAFVVVSGLLLTTNTVPAAVNWGLRF